jgi:hypothetical protein
MKLWVPGTPTYGEYRLKSCDVQRAFAEAQGTLGTHWILRGRYRDRDPRSRLDAPGPIIHAARLGADRSYDRIYRNYYFPLVLIHEAERQLGLAQGSLALSEQWRFWAELDDKIWHLFERKRRKHIPTIAKQVGINVPYVLNLMDQHLREHIFEHLFLRKKMAPKDIAIWVGIDESRIVQAVWESWTLRKKYPRSAFQKTLALLDELGDIDDYFTKHGYDLVALQFPHAIG